MAGVMVCEPRHLYNIINQYRWRSRLTEPNYLCLLDARSQREFDASHIITAQRIERNPAGEYLIPNPEELDYVRYCVVYDHDTGFLGCSDNQEEKKETGSSAASEPETIGSGSMCSQNTGEGDALHHARNLQHFTRHPVLLLKGGYKHFSACYHFLKSQKTLWMPQPLFPLLLCERKLMEATWECFPDNPETGLRRVQITEQTLANDEKKQAPLSHVVIWHSTQQMFSNRSTIPTKHCDLCLFIGRVTKQVLVPCFNRPRKTTAIHSNTGVLITRFHL
ncbi:serine/threonine/tyrosine-interacting-like protein 1 isoform X2 [Corvus moneduloides]|uniref:serine/threonine/tyrosine-interacting-like protein 1 isoform X2 n=1 Tax=Corvus moneduloides TaxID=1196302 RepID=UPI0013639660|nr:serine/threonine/tyrosine-interacting-like protein 1 isoform X2 [Corvus moneduloides]